jgi:hypothetical protein
MISLLAKKGLLPTKERKQIHPYALEVCITLPMQAMENACCACQHVILL